MGHLNAISDVDGSLVTSLKGHEEVTVAIAKLIASAPPAVIKSVFDTVPQVQSLNGNWFATMPVADAVKSYQAFLETATAVIFFNLMSAQEMPQLPCAARL